MEHQIRLRLVLLRPPANILYGIQKGGGTRYETHQKKLSQGDDLVFEISVELKKDTLGKFRLSGPFVQGTAGNKFLYIDIGKYAGQQDTEWARRLKIPLRGLAESVNGIAGGQIFELLAEGVGRDGGPNCGTLKPYEGWKKLN